LGCNIIQKEIKKEIKLDDKLLAVSVTNFPSRFIDELFKNKIIGISKVGKSLETGEMESVSLENGIFKNSRYIRGGAYWDGTKEWLFHGDCNGKRYPVILKYNPLKETNDEVELRVLSKEAAVPLELKDEIDEAILNYMTNNPDIDYQP